MIVVQLEQERLVAGSIVRAKVTFDEDEDGAKVVELSVLWETSGKGDTDRGLLHFEEVRNVRGERMIEVQLPLLPLTYHGFIVKIDWYVRARSGDFLFEERFEMHAIA